MTEYGEGKQIISSSWINESTKEHSRCKQWKLSYGYLWWIIDEKEHAYAAHGRWWKCDLCQCKEKDGGFYCLLFLCHVLRIE